MAHFNEALQISIISIGIVFASLLVFSFLIQIMGSYFQRIDMKDDQSALLERKKIAAIMTAFQEEFGDRIVEIKISRINRKESLK
ncbi:hypothetical protein BBF96_03150 [Anoxybacter fermentans]|uniref:Uncharacterized protein n=1 Tax=Anoxybacter fermentans TaxID=1323375 RepID=A0A3S9SW14_9FIRM|nr:OadG family protein [Anoxybacter fermentans]AZR72465.1 hypothetical protein BBF96_03150 [Anoxybacter fermentans]